jgi:hypothetical protein
MILVLPRRFCAFEKAEQFAAANFLTGGFHQERAASALADDGVDLAKQIFR